LFAGTALAAAAFAALAGLLSVPAAQADTLIATAHIAPGTLTVTGGTATVDPGDAQRLLLPLEVVDARGDGAGWSVFLTATPAAGPSTRVAHLLAPVVSCTTDSTCTLPVSTIAYPLDIPLTGAAVKVLNATPGTGMGGQATTLVLDGGVTAGQTVNTTVTVASGP
jgi:hypothetical protein